MLQPAAPQGVVSIAEVARRLQATESAVRQWLAAGKLRCAHRLDGQGHVIQTVILETDFLAFARQLWASPYLPFGEAESPSPALSLDEMPALWPTSFVDRMESQLARQPYVPMSWRWAATELRLVWIASGLIALVGAFLLTSWWPR